MQPAVVVLQMKIIITIFIGIIYRYIRAFIYDYTTVFVHIYIFKHSESHRIEHTIILVVGFEYLPIYNVHDIMYTCGHLKYVSSENRTKNK